MNLKTKLKQKIKNSIREVLNETNINNISVSNEIPKSTQIISSSLDGDIRIGERTFICKCEMVGGTIIIGNNTSINGPNTDIFCKLFPVKIGNFCSIARNVSIQEYNHKSQNVTSYFIKYHIFNEDWTHDITSNGAIEIGNDVWIGAQCAILSGSKIGDGAIIAANSVVVNEIPPYAIAAGSPAKVLKYRFSDEIIKKLKEIEWWNWSIAKIIKNYDFFEGALTLEKFDNIK